METTVLQRDMPDALERLVDLIRVKPVDVNLFRGRSETRPVLPFDLFDATPREARTSIWLRAAGHLPGTPALPACRRLAGDRREGGQRVEPHRQWPAERLRRHRGNAHVARQDLARKLGIAVSLRTMRRVLSPLRRQLRASGSDRAL